MRTGLTWKRCLGVMLLCAMAGCQTVSASRVGASDVDLLPPAVPANFEREAQDGTRSFRASQIATPARAPQVDFYIGMDQPMQGLVQVEGPNGPLWLYPQLIVQRADLKRVATLRTPQGQNLVQFELNGLGARKLAEVSAANVGTLLILVMDDKVAHLARVSAPMNRGSIYLSVPDDAAAQQLLLRIKG